MYNRLGRYLDGGPYSHTELVFGSGLSASSSFEDGGVRIKRIGYSSVGCWDFLRLPDSWQADALRWYKQHDGEGYDLIAQIKFGLGFLQLNDLHKWFCTESNVAALSKIVRLRPDACGPNRFYEILLTLGCTPTDSPWETHQ